MHVCYSYRVENTCTNSLHNSLHKSYEVDILTQLRDLGQVKLRTSTALSLKWGKQGRLVAQSVKWPADFGSGHDLTVCEFEPRVGLCADSSEPGACFGFCVSLSAPNPRTFCLCFSQK